MNDFQIGIRIKKRLRTLFSFATCSVTPEPMARLSLSQAPFRARATRRRDPLLFETKQDLSACGCAAEKQPHPFFVKVLSFVLVRSLFCTDHPVTIERPILAQLPRTCDCFVSRTPP